MVDFDQNCQKQWDMVSKSEMSQICIILKAKKPQRFPGYERLVFLKGSQWFHIDSYIES